MYTALDRVLPRYVNLIATCSFALYSDNDFCRSLLSADRRVVVVTTLWNSIRNFLHFLVVSIENPIRYFSLHIRLNSLPPKRYRIGIPISQSWKALVRMAETSFELDWNKHTTMLYFSHHRKRVIDCFVSFELCKYSIMYYLMNFASIFKGPLRLIVSNVFMRSASSHLEVHILFFFNIPLELSGCKDHVNFPLFFLNPHWLSRICSFLSTCTIRQFEWTLANIFLATDSKNMNLLLSQTWECPFKTTA